MNRYFLYLVMLNMLTNVIIFVPKYLIQYRFDGLLISILIAMIIGMGLMYVDTIVYARFPGQGLPEILEQGLNKPLKIIILVSFSSFWFVAGLLSLLGYIDILHRIINPELSKVWLLAAFLVVLGFVIQLPTQKVMYLLEIILCLNVPFIGFVFFKAVTSDYLNWDSIFEVGTHAATVPKLNPIAVASYIFSGYANIIIFNRLIKEKIKSINFVIILFISILTLFTSVFVPIGMHGSYGVEEYIYPWIITADSLRLPYSPVERVVFIFLMLYINITLISVSVHWHVAFELMKGVYTNNNSKKKNRLLMAFFFGLSILVILRIDFMHPELISMYWLIARFFVEIIAVIGFFFFLRRKI
ncbi:GerAB/ArcD/ProY family transporter [Neobacillus sp. CF12]|uniref:GerAB/ArcD/ProY family transporter n=1 Tax=Neobacillus sp. CF12 TaxID=3055864 RepID=UPI0025A03B1D|nr:GerAB/ArcD/ProY family transporter [Neobacillus sp. CF12]MDM5327325.1 GerAB/ArcD/ProY family transporter [Neobacillus sp. CF12]